MSSKGLQMAVAPGQPMKEGKPFSKPTTVAMSEQHHHNKKHNTHRTVAVTRLDDEARNTEGTRDLQRAMFHHKVHDRFDGWFRRRNTFQLFLTMTVIVLTVLVLELGYQEKMISSQTDRENVSNGLIVVVWLISFVQVMLVFDYHRVLANVESKIFQLPTYRTWFGCWAITWHSEFQNAVLESLVYLMYPLPFINTISAINGRWCPHIYDKDCSTDDNYTEESLVYPWVHHNFALFVFLRLYIIGRVLRDYSIVFRTRGLIIRVMQTESPDSPTLTRTDFTPHYVIKYYLKEDPARFIGGLIASTWLVYGYMLHVCERSHNQSSFGFGDSLWCVFITMSTIGYGDRFATSSEGRIVTILAGSTGLICAALLTMAAIQELTETEIEQAHHVNLDLYHCRQGLKHECCGLIQTYWRRHKYLKNQKNNGLAISTVKMMSFQVHLGKKAKKVSMHRLRFRNLGGTYPAMNGAAPPEVEGAPSTADLAARIEKLEKVIGTLAKSIDKLAAAK